MLREFGVVSGGLSCRGGYGEVSTDFPTTAMAAVTVERSYSTDSACGAQLAWAAGQFCSQPGSGWVSVPWELAGCAGESNHISFFAFQCVR